MNNRNAIMLNADMSLCARVVGTMRNCEILSFYTYHVWSIVPVADSTNIERTRGTTSISLALWPELYEDFVKMAPVIGSVVRGGTFCGHAV